MKRVLGGLALVCALVVSVPLEAQLNSLPVFVSPKGGTGFTLAGTFGRGANDESGKNTALSLRASLGISAFAIGAGIGTVNPQLGAERETEIQYMGNLSVRVLGGPLVPVAVNLHGGVGYLETDPSGIGSTRKTLNVPVGVGFALNVPTPGFSIEPWVAPRISILRTEEGGNSDTQTGFGVSAGLNLGLATGLGLHAAFDWADLGAGELLTPADLPAAQPATFGIGLQFTFSLPGLGVPGVPGV